MAKNSIYHVVRKKTNEFAGWILGYVPQSVKKPINEKVEKVNQQVSDTLKGGTQTGSKFVNQRLR